MEVASGPTTGQYSVSAGVYTFAAADTLLGVLISYTYKIAFSAGQGNDYGLASAISIYIFIIVGTISAISFARSRALREDRA